MKSDPSVDETLPFVSDDASEGELTPGQILGEHYRVEARIGRGAMGAVYVVEHLGLGKRFAAKVVSSARASDRNAVKRLRTEARTLSAIEHENIVTVTHLGQTEDGRLFVVMELLEGRDLGERMSQQRRLAEQGEAPPWLPDEEVADFVPQLLSALTAAHQAQVVHRDLKPDNLFLADKRDRTVLKVVDFGISKMKQIEDAPSLTQTGQILGTPLYMAPEQGKSTAQVDARADLYSFGCILHEMLTGQPPFVADGVYDCIVKHATETPLAPSVLRPGLSPELDAIVLRCLQKKPGNRFANAAEVLTAFEQAWAHGPSFGKVSGERPRLSPASESRTDRAQNETLDASASEAVATAVLAASSVTASGPVDAPPSRTRMAMIALGLLLLLGAGGVYVARDSRTNRPVAAEQAPVNPAPVADPDDAPPPSDPTHETPPVADHPSPTPVDDPADPGAESDARGSQVAPASVDVRLQTQPPGATVYLMGESLGRTPIAVPVTPGEDVIVEVARAGYRMRHVTLSADEPSPNVVRMRRNGPAAPALAPR